MKKPLRVIYRVKGNEAARSFTVFALAMLWLTGMEPCAGAIPEGYYNSLEGKSGEALATAIRQLTENHTAISYGNWTWEAFLTTDVAEVNGRQLWRDMYSNNIVWLPEHDSMNIEHTVANSWWGGEKNAAYKDLYHLNPADQDANGRKSNYPPGMVATAGVLDNGVMRIGNPLPGQGGGAPNVFEPADENKGDFARAILYVITTYPGIGWKEEYNYLFNAGEGGLTLQPWAIELLRSWDALDPVDSLEKARNEAIYALQHNRNPFIDIENLANYIYGEDPSGCPVTETMVMERPGAPIFAGCRLTAINTYTGRWWEPRTVTIEHEGDLWISIDNGEYSQCNGEISFAAAADDYECHTVKAYVKNPEIVDRNGSSLRSAVSTLTMTGDNPDAEDFSTARWRQVTCSGEFECNSGYILLSANTQHIMSATGGSGSLKYMPSAGFVDFDAEGFYVTELPREAAVVRFSYQEGMEYPYTLSVYDTRGNFKGYWNVTGKNSMKLDTGTATRGKIVFETDGSFSFIFPENGSLQYNRNQPRYLNYTSTQGKVNLYKYIDGNGGAGIYGSPREEEGVVSVSGNCICIPPGGFIYDMSGRMVSGKGLLPGIYIAGGPGIKTVKIKIN